MTAIFERRFRWNTPWLRILLALAVVALLAAGAARLKFDNSTEAFFLAGDETLTQYESFRKLFASDEFSLITFNAPAHPDARFVAGLRQLEAKLSTLPHVRRVRTIASVRTIQGRADELEVRGYLDGADDSAIAARLEQARQHPYYKERFISADGDTLGIVVETEVLPGAIDYKIELRRQIREAIQASNIAPLAPTVVGAPIIDADVRDIVQKESGLFGALVVLIVAAGFFAVFRSVVAVLIPLAVTFLAVGSTFGLMGWLGMPATLLTPILPSFLISVGVGSSIFLLTHYFLARARTQLPGSLVARDTVRRATAPCAIASLTTSAALLAFASSDIAPVRDIGIALGMGLLFALLLTFTLGTGLLELLAPSVSQQQAARLMRRSAWLGAVDRFAARHQNLVVIVAAFATVAAAVALTGLKTDYYYLGTFKESTAIRKDYKESDARLPGSASIEVVLNGPRDGTFTEPAALQKLDNAAKDIAAYSDLQVSAYSIADVSKEINQALHENKPSAYRIPATRQAAAQGMLLFESSGNDELKNLVTPDYRQARLTLQLPTVPESRSFLLTAHIDRVLAQEFKGTEIRYTLTGLVPMWARINSHLRDTQIESVLLAFGVTTLVLIVYARSLRVGLLLAFVNASVVVIVLGIMAALGWPLDPYTVLVADIAIGVLDDDSIHFFSAIRQQLREGRSIDEAITLARDSAGQAMTYLALCLIAGFSVYVLSSVASLAMFGTLAALVIGLGLAWEWVVMPAYLAVLYRRGLFR